MDIQNQHPNHDLRSFKQAQVVVVMVPYPSHSHLNQLLQLSCLISSYNIEVHYACSATDIRRAKLRFNEKNSLESAKIHFHEFPNSVCLEPSVESSFHLRDPTIALLRELSPTAKKIVVIHDYYMGYVVQDTATIPNAESYAFNPVSGIVSFLCEWELKGRPFRVEEVPERLLLSTEQPDAFVIQYFFTLQSQFVKLTPRAGTIFNSCRLIEGTYIDLFSKEEICGNKKVWAVGPLNQPRAAVHDSNNKHNCLEWLDKQAPNSVLFVSFGTTTSMTNEQIEELALGLEQSEQKFIWVFREADKGNIFEGDFKRAELLPEDYEERIKEVGLVVRDWAPQLEILGHSSTGGFMSHCGWNSCMESITMGVPLAAWPIQYDQPQNAFLVTDVLKVGLLVNQSSNQNELVTSSTIAKAVERLMASKEGDEIRKRAEELGGATLQSVKEGGVSRMELDSFIAHINS